MMKPLALLLGLMVVTVCAQSKFTVWTPPELADKINKMDNKTTKISVGNFGHIPWDKQVNGYIYPVVPDNGCVQQVDWRINSTHKEDKTPIMIVRRGGCNFVKKAHNAELAGARMLIVVNDKDSVDYEMIDDESGFSETLNIPTIMVSKPVGDAILADLQSTIHNTTHKNPSRVMGIASFAMMKTEKVNYEVWLSSSDRHSVKFIEAFFREYRYLKNDANLRIRHVTIEHTPWAPYDKERENCISGGRYCATHPSTDKSHFGRDNLMEDLRQHCIAEKQMDKFHDYVENYGIHCFTSTNMAGCSAQTMRNLSIDVDGIIRCVNETFEPKNSATPINYWIDDNKYFRQELKDKKEKSISKWPAAYVNGLAIKDTLTADNLFETVCASLIKPPRECSYKEWDEEHKTSHNPEAYKKTSAFWVVLLIIFALLILFVLVFYFVYRRIVKQQLARELSLSVNSAVANYVKMNEGRQA